MYGLRRIGLETIGMTHIAGGQIDEAAPTAGPPDWDAVTEEIACPLCEYNLRGLAEPRCPECGYRFVWQEMLGPTQRLHPYLFEHHPERNVWSFFKTFTGHLRPIRFWRQLHPNQPARPWRLFLFWSLIAVLNVVSIATTVVCIVNIERSLNLRQRVFVLSIQANPQSPQRGWLAEETRRYGSVQEYLDTHWPTTTAGILRRILLGEDNPVGALLILFLMWPWLTMATFWVLCRKLGSARARTSNFTQIVVYSWDVFVWPCLAVFVVLVIAGITWVPGQPTMPLMKYALGWFALLGLAAFAWVYRLIVAFKFYLRFERPLAIVIGSQVILVLIVVDIVVAIVYL